MELLSRPRLNREYKTVSIMIEMYCNAHHQTSKLCKSCTELQNYALIRLDRCFYQEEKPTCANCPIHCYRKSKAIQMKAVMRYAGPRMMFRHPILAIKHMMDGRRKVQPPLVLQN